MPSTRVLSVGQCSYDQGAITRTLEHAFDVRVKGAVAKDDALEALRSEPFDLVLVNRILDRDGSSGLDLIRAMKADPELAEVPVMLVSNYGDAQADAVAIGALRGFGKVELRDPATRDRLAEVLNPSSQASSG
jgi:response regulator RpfG family c-di-GMP phosphodiesterase